MAFSAGDRTVGAGRGTGIALDLTEARWGAGSAFAGTGADMSTALLALSGQSGYVFAGLPVGDKGRLAMALTQSSDDQLVGLDGRTGGATGAAASYMVAPAAGWKVSVSAALLDEQGLLLGANGAGALGLGNARSTSLGLGTSVELGDGWQLGADGVVARSAATRNAASLVTGTSPLLALGFGAALKKAGLLDEADDATLAVTKPLRVYAGHAELDMPVGLDADGNVLTERRRATLTPQGSETALSLGYARPVGDRARLGLTVSFREDADNVPGRAALGAMLRFAASF
jgi:hypothetical protein